MVESAKWYVVEQFGMKVVKWYSNSDTYVKLKKTKQFHTTTYKIRYTDID